jgi:DNA-binding NarL/FixJ family response regulator
MKRLIIIQLFLLLCALVAEARYTDHRDRQIDSLENVVAGWTDTRIEQASALQLEKLVDAYRELMFGYEGINPSRSEFFARKLWSLSERTHNLKNAYYATDAIGRHRWAGDQLDSADYYFGRALSYADQMALTVGQEGGYVQDEVDDFYSKLYGALGNLCYSRDDIPGLMEYYQKAGEIFEKHGWNESNAVLWHNMGSVWYDEGDLDKARECYEKSLHFGTVAGDSLWMASPKLGLAEVYFSQGKTTKALQYLKEADEYYSKHEDLEYRGRIATLDVMGKVLESQKRHRAIIASAAVLLAIVLLVLVFVLFRALRLSKEKKAADAVIEEIITEAESEKPTAGEKPLLTDREMEILPLVAEGLTNKEIAAKLYLTEQTIKWYRMRLNAKFEAKNASQLIVKAKEMGIV